MGIDAARPQNTVDTDYDLFWREVIDAVKHVELNHGLSYVIERGTKSANVRFVEKQFDAYVKVGGVVITILEVEPKQPALMVP